MKPYQYTLTHAFVRLLWVPRVGDPVILRDAGGKHRTKIRIAKPAEIYLDNGAGPFVSHQLFYRSPPSAVRHTWDRLRSLCEYVEETESGRWIAGVRVNGTMTILKGKTVRIVAQLLELRAIDIRINEGVNRLANDIKRSGALRIVTQESNPS